MTNQYPLAIVGCGGMGHRHLHGLAELQNAGLSQFRLVAVCDPVRENAESLAEMASDLLEKKPCITETLDDLAAAIPDLQAVDITTDPRHHHYLAIAAFDHGWNIMVEKPMGLTVRACNRMISVASTSNRIFSVAENYRRDPMYRLAKALLDAGVIGTPRLFLQNSIGGANRMLITPWRHQKDRSGILLDVGVHYADIMQYLLGPVDSVYAQTRLYEKTRINPVRSESKPPVGGRATDFYYKWQINFPHTFECTAEDAAYGVVNFQSGAVGHFLDDHAGHGQSIWQRSIFGSAGSIELPGDRSGNAITVTQSGGKSIRNEDLLALVPKFKLDEATAALFGGERLSGYAFESFAIIDRKITAIEYAEFGEAIGGHRPPEVGADEGMRAVAVCYAMLESGASGLPVRVEDIIHEKLGQYEMDINSGLGLA